MARSCRRRHAGEALEFERERALALQAQLEEIVTELEGPELDEEAFSRMAPADAAVVREALGSDGDEDAEQRADEIEETLDEQREERETEIARLQASIVECERRQGAFERYLEALDG